MLAAAVGMGMARAAAADQTSPAALPPLSRSQFITNVEDLARIERAAPTKAIAVPKRPRRLLLFCLNVGYGGHPSIDYANQAFSWIGDKTGAFETVVSRDPAVFRRESLDQFDAVFFNNTVGDCFTDPELRQNLVEFVYGGGGLLGVHGTTVAFTRWPGAHEDWPEFGLMIGARGANHRESTERVTIKVEDPDHPLTRVFNSQGFAYRDEFFRVHDPYSRERVRVLLSIDTARTQADQGRGFGDLQRADNDYALAWVRHYGRGRVFYSTIAHNPYVFWDPDMLQFYLGTIQFALGDLPAPTLPSARLTPATRAQEQLGWRVGFGASESSPPTLFVQIDQARQVGLCYLGATSLQTVSADIPRLFGPELTADDQLKVRLKLDAAGVRLVTCLLPSSRLTDEQQCRSWFEFGRKMGIEAFVTEAQVELPIAGKELSQRYGIEVAVGAPQTRQPAQPNIRSGGVPPGAVVDLSEWARSGVDVKQAVQGLKDRPAIVYVQDLDPASAVGRKTKEALLEMHRLHVQPIMLTFVQQPGASFAKGEAARSIEALNSFLVSLVK